MKSKIKVLLVAAVVICALANATAAQATAYSVVAGSMTGSYPSTLNVPIMARGFGSGISGINFDLYYDSNLLTISGTGYTDSALTGSNGTILVNTSTLGTVSYLWYNVSTPVALSSSTIATINFAISTTTVTSTNLTFAPYDTSDVSDAAGDTIGSSVTFTAGTLSLNPPTAPTASTTITFSDVSTSSFTMHLSEVAGATSYMVYQNDELATTTALTTLYPRNITPDTLYSYYVVATNAGGNGPTSSVFSTTTLPLPPSAPSAPTLSNVGQNSLTVGWDAVSGATYYVVYQNSVAVVTTSATSTNRSSLTASTSYTYAIVAGNSGGVSAASDSTSTTTLPGAPDAPSAPTFSGVTSSSLVVSWADVTYALYYKLYENGTLVTTTAATTSNRTGLTTDTLYTYYVLAGNTGGWSTSSTAAATTTLPLPPSAPSTPTFSSIAQTTLSVNWSAVSGATYYRVYKDGAAVATTTDVTYAATDLTANTTYSFYIIAGNAGGTSVSSTAAEVTTLPNPPTAPSDIDVADIAATSITVIWADNSSDETAFVVEQSTDGETYSVVATTSINATSTSATGLTPNTAYLFRVKAVNTGGSSSYVTAPLPAYTNSAIVTSQVVTASTSATISLQWSANSNPAGTNYRAYVTGVSTSTVTSAGSTVTATISGLTPNTQYTINIQSQNHDNTYNSAQQVTEYTAAAAPSTPTVSDITTESVLLTWTSNSNPGATVYYVAYSNGTLIATTTNVTTSVSGLAPNTSYQFKVRAENLGAAGTYSAYSSNSTATATLPAVPGTPTATASGDGQVDLTWSANSNGASTVYEIYNENTEATVTSSATTRSITGLDPDTQYRFRVRALHLNDESTVSSYSAYSSVVRTLANVPSAPTVGDATTTVSALSVSFSGGTNPSNITYAIYNVTDGNYLDADGLATTTPIFQATSTWGTELVATGLTDNTAYQFAIIARNSSSTNSATSSANTAVYTIPGTVSGLTATAASASQINLSWTAMGSATYHIYRSTNDSSYTSIGTASVNSYSNTGLTARTQYYYKVAAVNSSGEGKLSSAMSTITLSGGSAGGSSSGSSGSGNTTYNISMNGSQYLGVLSVSGFNVVLYIGSNAGFTVAGGVHNLKVQDLNMSTGEVEFVVSSNPQVFKLKPGTSKELDLNGDKKNDIKIAYNTLTTNRIDVTVQALAVTSVSTTPTTVTTVNTTPIVQSVTSAVVISKINTTTFNPGASLKFTYAYKNTTSKTVNVKFVRQLVDSKGKVVKSSTISKSLKKGATYTNKVSEALPGNLKSGTYTVKVKVLDNKSKVVDQNSFDIAVVKKYFILGADLPVANEFTFDTKMLNAVKSNVALPTSLKLKYTYKNSTGKTQSIRMVRELVNDAGKVLVTKNGKWSLKAGQKDSTTFTQALDNKLTAGNYQIRLRAYDATSKALLAENSVGFTVEAR